MSYKNVEDIILKKKTFKEVYPNDRVSFNTPTEYVRDLESFARNYLSKEPITEQFLQSSGFKLGSEGFSRTFQIFDVTWNLIFARDENNTPMIVLYQNGLRGGLFRTQGELNRLLDL